MIRSLQGLPAALFSRLRTAFGGSNSVAPSPTLTGRPLGGETRSSVMSTIQGQQVSGLFVREPLLAYTLAEMLACSRVARGVLSYLVRDCFSSMDGDDQGWAIADTLEDGETRIDPDVKVILSELIERSYGDTRVIGGGRLRRAIWEAAAYGDSWLELGISKEGLSSKPSDYSITTSQYLPVWQIFAVTDPHENVIRYEQRAKPRDPDPLVIEPVKTLRFSYERMGLYGQSIFRQSCERWRDDIRDLIPDIRTAARALGCDPNLHIMPEGVSPTFKESYRQEYEALLQDGIITDLFLDNGAMVKRMSGGGNATNSSISELMKLYINWQAELIPPGFPIWLFAGMPSDGAREISGQPALAYARLRNDLCGLVTEQIRRACDIELILKLGPEEFKRRGRYRVTWSRFHETTTAAGLPINLAESDEIPDTEGDSGVASASTPPGNTSVSKPKPATKKAPPKT